MSNQSEIRETCDCGQPATSSNNGVHLCAKCYEEVVDYIDRERLRVAQEFLENL